MDASDFIAHEHGLGQPRGAGGVAMNLPHRLPSMA